MAKVGLSSQNEGLGEQTEGCIDGVVVVVDCRCSALLESPYMLEETMAVRPEKRYRLGIDGCACLHSGYPKRSHRHRRKRSYEFVIET